MIAEVIPEGRTFNDIEVFSYIIPEHLEDLIGVGSIVKVPFGKRTIRGVVRSFAVCSQSSAENSKNSTDDPRPATYELKEIKSVDTNFKLPEKYIEIAEWISKYYLCTSGEAISLFLPPDMKRPRMSVISNRLSVISTKENIALNDEQQAVFEEIRKEVNGLKSIVNSQLEIIRPFLLHGVTGSGKTEIYIKVAKEVIDQGKQVVVLVPEIMLTPQTVERFEEVFGENVALMHSNLSKSEKYNCYSDFYAGKKPIIVGPRSALLIPSKNIGLIIIDEEQEDSFKQEANPRYHAITLAEKIAEKFGTILILGSATPRIETYHKAKIGQYNLLELKNRHNQNTMPKSKLVDLRNEVKLGNFSPLSEVLQERIANILNERRQILLFLNRRGTATFVSCRDCGFISLCPNCLIPLVYYTNSKSEHLSCHHCGHKETVPQVCPDCHGHRIKYFGAGIDKIFSEIEKLFPNARIFKVDSTTITSKNDYEKFYRKFKNHEVDIVIGTQMIAKGLDIPNVDLVGIVSADTGLNMPHYKANEKTFQILTQVSGRSGRKSSNGETILQTYWPDALPIIAALKHNFDLFYDAEIVEREKFDYPPFSKIVRVISENTDQKRAQESINIVAKDLKADGFTIIGPGACFYQKLHNKFRYHLMIKCDKVEENLTVIWKKYPSLVWDVEPVNLL